MKFKLKALLSAIVLLSLGINTGYAREEKKDPHEGKAFKELRQKASKRRSNGTSITNIQPNNEKRRGPLKDKYVGDGPFEFGVSIVYAEDVDRGMYTFTDVGIFYELAIGEIYDAAFGGIKSDGKYFIANMFGYDYYNLLFNASTWELMKSTDSANLNTFSSALAEDPTDGKIYGCFLDSTGDNLEFGTLDINNFERTSTICELEYQWEAASFDEYGNLYVLLPDGTLNKVDKKTGAHTLVGQTGIPMQYLSTGIINHRDAKFYFFSSTDTEWKLYAINVDTAKATEVFDMGEDIQFRGMFIGDPLAEDKAPFASSKPELEFDGGALSGYVNFTAPDKLYDGSAPEGKLKWHLLRTDTEVSSGDAEWGQSLRVPFSVNNAGFYRVSVVMSNEAGRGPESTIRCYIGNDYPKMPANISLEREGNNNVIRWDAVTEGANGSYVDPKQITYSVYRYPDLSCIAENLTSTSYTDYMEEPAETTVYRYAVTATFDGREGDAAVTDDLTLGALNLPFQEEFANAASAEKFKIIDANGDGTTWEYSMSNHGMNIRYSKELQMDDWIVTPPFHLEAGRKYFISFDAWESVLNYGREKVEAFVGMSPTPNGLNNQIIPVTEVGEKENLTGVFVPEVSGSYYLGIHGCSDPSNFYLYVSNLLIEDGVFDDSPAKGELKVVPDYNMENKAKLLATAPVEDVSGNKLNSLVKMVIKRDGVQIFEKMNPTPGEVYEFNDEVPEAGYYKYALVGYVESGAGKVLETKVHIGLNLPGAPTNVKVKEIDDSGKVIITWDAPEVDNDGNAINPDLLSYSIFDYDNDEIAAYLKEKSYTYQATSGGRQSFVLYYVHAESAAGLNEYKFGMTPLTAVGTPYTIPFTETFANGTLGSMWGQGGYGDWTVIGSSNSPLADAQDSDNGMVCWTPTYANTVGRFFSGKISLANAVNPAMTFYYFGVPESDASFDVTARNLSDGELAQTVASYKISDGEGWTPVVVNLEAFKGKNIEIGLSVNCGNSNKENVLFDNFRVLNKIPDNLSAVNLNVPRDIHNGDTVDATVTLENIGSNDAEEFTVSLYCNRAKVAQSEPLSLQAGKSTDVTLSYRTTPFTPSSLTCYAEIEYEKDGDTSDNSTARAEIRVSQSPYPGVTDVTGSVVEGIPMLTWETPQIDDSETAEKTEDFESYDAFVLNPQGEWAFVDMDGSSTYAIQGVSFPNNGARMAYIVFDASHNGFSNSYAANSGTKYMASMASAGGYNDDWMISPELNGESQTISFYAKSYTDAYNLEAFQVMVSSTDRDVESFTMLAEQKRVPTSWTRYEYVLPAGTLYFAIRCVSEDSFIFMVDDVTYTPQSPLMGLELKGYNIYKDSKEYSFVTSEEFRDNVPVSRTNSYNITALYNKGESVLSETVTLEDTHIQESFAEGVEIRIDRNRVVIMAPGNEYVTVQGTDGLVYHQGYGNASITLDSGIYLVSYRGKTEKIIIK